jgi:hypothetical protein
LAHIRQSESLKWEEKFANSHGLLEREAGPIEAASHEERGLKTGSRILPKMRKRECKNRAIRENFVFLQWSSVL